MVQLSTCCSNHYFYKSTELKQLWKIKPMKAFEAYVNSLNIQELRDLVLKFAPKSYREEVATKATITTANLKVLKQSFDKASTYFKTLFDNEEDLYNIGKFELKVEKACNKIKPYSRNFPEEITEIICDFFEEVEEAFDDNYLYNHYNDDAYEGREFGVFIGEFIADIPNEYRAASLTRILSTRHEMGYGFADNTEAEIIAALPAKDWEAFTPIVVQGDFMDYLNNKQKIATYRKIEPYLIADNKEQLLKGQADSPNSNFELAQLYIAQNRHREAFDTLKNFLKSSGKKNDYHFFYDNEIRHQQFQLLIQLSEEHFKGKNTQKWLDKYLAVEPNVEAFQFVTKTRPEKRATFEQYLEENNLNQYFEVLESEDRLQEVVDGFKKHAEQLSIVTQYQFFQRHKSSFPKEAMVIFKTLLDEVLPKTGNHAYSNVVEYLEQLKAVMSPTTFRQLVKSIRENYYRRRNLLKMLNEKQL